MTLAMFSSKNKFIKCQKAPIVEQKGGATFVFVNFGLQNI